MNEYEQYFKAREEYEKRLLDRNRRIALRVWFVLIPLFFCRWSINCFVSFLVL